MKNQFLTTFNTPYGQYWFTILPFWLTLSGDFLLYKLNTAYNGLPGVIGIADDVTKCSTQKDGSYHDANFKAFLKITRQNGLKLNASKTHYRAEGSSSMVLHLQLIATD